jgi:hypothetical protein
VPTPLGRDVPKGRTRDDSAQTPEVSLTWHWTCEYRGPMLWQSTVLPESMALSFASLVTLGGIMDDPTISQPHGYEGATEHEVAVAKPPWYKRGWVKAVALVLLGVVLGSAIASTSDPRDSAEYKALTQDVERTRTQLQSTEDESASSQDELSSTQDELASTQAELSSAQDELSSTKAKLVEVVGDLPAREKAVEKAEAAAKSRQEALDQREADVRAAAEAVAEREQAVGAAETEIANNTIPGEGVFQVGVDMQAGLYRTSGAADCYYAVLADANGNNIKSNNITSGPATVTVAAGDYFETSRCADWILQQ